MQRIAALFLLIISASSAVAQQTYTRNDASLQGDAGATSGFFETIAPVNYPAGATSWWHLLDVRHSNNTNNYAMQFAGSFGDQNLYFRKTVNIPATAWSRVILERDGKTGIGTLNPQTALQIGDLGSSGNKQLMIPGVYNFEQVRLGQTGNGSAAMELITHNDGNTAFGFKLAVNRDVWGQGLNFQYAPLATDYGSLSYQSAMLINTNGKVGIGTLTPEYDLDLTRNLRVGAQGGSDVTLVGGGSGIGSYLKLFYANGQENTRLKGNGDSYLNAFYGNLGIGTDNPTEKLTVSGKIKTREVIVQPLGWSDYVFEKDYKNLSLPEIEAFIQKNKHLPEIPSAKEVEKEGIAVGEMNKLLLKKIEELTLHLIELNKKMAQMEAKK